MKNLVFGCLLLWTSSLWGQSYMLHVSSADDSSDIVFAKVSFTANGVHYVNETTDLNGNFWFPYGILQDTSRTIEVGQLGYETFCLKPACLKPGIPYEVKLKRKLLGMDELILVHYRVPIIEKTKKAKRKKNMSVETDSVLYSPAEIAAFDQLRGKGWNLEDSLPAGGRVSEALWYRAVPLSYHMDRPLDQRNVSEKMLFVVVFNQQGKAIHVQLRQGKQPLFALAAAKAIAHMPCLVFPTEPPFPAKVEIIMRFYFRVE